MIRATADRAFLPAKSLFEQVGNMIILTGKTVVAAIATSRGSMPALRAASIASAAIRSTSGDEETDSETKVPLP